jgi:hypothetical protein
MSQRKETYYITREEKHTRIRVAENDYNIVRAYASSNDRTLTAELHYLIFEASHCRLDDHLKKIKKLEGQLDQVIKIAQEYKQKFGPLN